MAIRRRGRRTCGGEVKQRFWLQKYGFTRVLGTLAKLGFCTPLARPQELKPRKKHVLEGLRMAIRRRGRRTSGGEVKQRSGWAG